MHFVPIPTTREALDKTAPHWLPFVERLAKHTKEPLQGMIETVLGGRTQIGLVWDGEKALALLGWQFKRVGHQLIAERRVAHGSRREGVATLTARTRTVS